MILELQLNLRGNYKIANKSWTAERS